MLVRLQPYAVLKEIENDQGATGKDGRGHPEARWNGNDWVAVWHAWKWGNEDLVVYEIANDKIKREEKMWPEVVKYFDRDWKKRFLKKYPKEGDDHYTFVSDDSDLTNFEFKGDTLLLEIRAENKPNLAPGPIWSAELRAVWNLKPGSSTKSISSRAKSVFESRKSDALGFPVADPYWHASRQNGSMPMVSARKQTWEPKPGFRTNY